MLFWGRCCCTCISGKSSLWRSRSSDASAAIAQRTLFRRIPSFLRKYPHEKHGDICKVFPPESQPRFIPVLNACFNLPDPFASWRWNTRFRTKDAWISVEFCLFPSQVIPRTRVPRVRFTGTKDKNRGNCFNQMWQNLHFSLYMYIETFHIKNWTRYCNFSFDKFKSTWEPNSF